MGGGGRVISRPLCGGVKGVLGMAANPQERHQKVGAHLGAGL